MTPLQLACSTDRPDAETVRTLLDKGAHPNWRDASMRSSFDLVLVSHKAKAERALHKAPEPKGSKKMSMHQQDPEEPFNEIQEFIQVALPVLMELVRKGARYTPESIASLRPSFQEAINSGLTHWGMQVESEEFQTFVDSIPGQICNSKVSICAGAMQLLPVAHYHQNVVNCRIGWKTMHPLRVCCASTNSTFPTAVTTAAPAASWCATTARTSACTPPSPSW